MTGILKICAVLFMAGLFTETAQLVGCEKKKDDRPVTSIPPAPTGTLSLAITDAPADGARRIVVELKEIELTRTGSNTESEIEFDPPLQLDILALQGLSSESLVEALEIPAGAYELLKISINADTCAAFPPGSEDPAGSFIELADGSFESLLLPQGARKGLRLADVFTLAPDSAADFTIDFDLRKSVSKPTGVECHHLRPSLRLVDNTTAGLIRGVVAESLINEPGCGDEDPDTGSLVYVYSGGGATPDDLGDSGAGPLTSERVLLNSDSGNYEYVAGFLPAGDYTVALTCQGLADQPDMDDVVVFQQPASVSVDEGQTTTHDFTAAEPPP